MKGNFNPYICFEAKHLAQSLSFIIETRKEVDPTVRTADIYELYLRSLRYGNVIRYENNHDQIVGVVCYSIGTADHEFADNDVVHIDYGIMVPGMQRTRLFVKCIDFTINTIYQEYEGIKYFKFEAFEDSIYNNRLYSKFARFYGQKQGKGRLLNCYIVESEKLQEYVERLLIKR